MEDKTKFLLVMITSAVVFSVIWFFVALKMFTRCFYLEYLKKNHCTIFGANITSWNIYGLVILGVFISIMLGFYYLNYKKNGDFKKFFRVIRFFPLIYGIFLLFIVLVGIFAVFLSPVDNFFTPFDIMISQIILILALLFSGLLLIITFYGISHSKIYAKITGLIGAVIILLGTIISLIIVNGGTLTTEVFLMEILPSLSLILLFSIFWKKIPSENKIQVTSKTKKLLLFLVIGIVIISFLIIVIPNTQKHLALDSLEYADYEEGWGFNPPENWQIDDNYYPILSPPSEDNVSEKVLLAISIGTTSSNIDEIGQKQLEEFENDFWTNNTKNFTIISNGKKVINGMDSYELIYSYEPVHENGTIGQEMKIKTIVVIKSNKAIHATYQCFSIYYKKYESIVDKSLNSLMIA